jgi:hypothetical protein
LQPDFGSAPVLIAGTDLASKKQVPPTSRSQCRDTHKRAPPESTGSEPLGTPTPKCAFNCSAVNPATERGVVVPVPWFAVVVVTEEDAGRVVWLEEHPAVTIARTMAAIRQRRKDLT